MCASITKSSFSENADKTKKVICTTTGYFMDTIEDVSPTLLQRDWKDPPVVAYAGKKECKEVRSNG